MMYTCSVGVRLTVARTGTVVCLDLVFWGVATTGPLSCVAGLLFCFPLDLLVYTQHQAGELLYAALLLQVWEDYRPTQVNFQSQLSRRNVGVPLQKQKLHSVLLRWFWQIDTFYAIVVLFVLGLISSTAAKCKNRFTSGGSWNLNYMQLL